MHGLEKNSLQMRFSLTWVEFIIVVSQFDAMGIEESLSPSIQSDFGYEQFRPEMTKW